MLDRASKSIFIHQRKTGGVAVIGAFGYTPDSPDWHAYNNGVLDKGWEARPAGYYIFTTIRNPFDRLISAWKYLESTRNRGLLEVLLNPPQEGADYRHLTRPQVAILRDTAGNLVPDYLMRFEHLQEDFDAVCDRIGKPRTALRKVNVGDARERHYRPYFNVDTRHLAETLFRDDLDAFGYSF
ncbi:MAG: sulfotransferase family 2 domain-containing protein [Candidatus Kaistia colombiensis]|nr:MAG: sulfotransferase family 2 domain-containing protein [Kaistia sp.]